MEELIKNIVEADKVARGRINEKIHERDNVHSQILEKRSDVISKYQEESRKRIEERRAQLEEELKAAAMVEETRYQNTLEQLNRQVEAHREEWVSKLTAQCLKMEGCS